MVYLTEKEFIKLAQYVKENYGVDLTEKKVLIEGRLQSVLVQKGFKNFSEYYDNLVSDKTGVVAAELMSKVTTNYTFFMREKEHFNYLKNSALPYIVYKYGREKDLRIWSAGCSSGEEAYTIAMILEDYFSEQKGGWNKKLLATDISSNVLEKAVQGVYAGEQVEGLPNHWKISYFTRLDREKWEVSSKIKNEIIFRRFNLMNETFPFKKKFHVIFCRNVMIYFDLATKQKLVDKFYELTEYGGYLFIGHSESLNFGGNKYKYVMPSIYRKE